MGGRRVLRKVLSVCNGVRKKALKDGTEGIQEKDSGPS